VNGSQDNFIVTKERGMDVTSHPAILALSAALRDAVYRTGVPVDSIEVERLEAHEWSDSCLGAPTPNEGCADVVTPGYIITLADGSTYHADRHGHVRRAKGHAPVPDTEIRLRFTQEGGIGGWSSEYEVSSETLSEDEERQLRQLVEDADFFNVPNSLPKGGPIPDGYTYTLWIAVGRRSHTVIRYDGVDENDSAALRELFAWVAERAPAPGPAGAIGPD